MHDVLIKVEVNGVQIEGFEIRRTHLDAEGITLSGHTLLRLKKNDEVTVKLVPLTDDMNYALAEDHARLSLKLERRF